MASPPKSVAVHIDVRVALAVCVGGSLGALARRGLSLWLPVGGTHGWPWATFAANLVGTAVLGVLLAAVAHLPQRALLLRPLLGAGFCGALTTFSTLQVELIRLGRHGHAGLAAGYLGASLAGGLVLAAIAWPAIAGVRTRAGRAAVAGAAGPPGGPGASGGAGVPGGATAPSGEPAPSRHPGSGGAPARGTAATPDAVPGESRP